MHYFLIPLFFIWLSIGSATLRYRGADFSSLLLLESTSNICYARDVHAECQPLERILRDFGVNLARIRIWVTRTYDLKYGLELAKRAKAAGMDLVVDLHYCDTWADAGHQAIPQGWPTDLEGLASKVYDYTYTVVEAFRAQGTPIELIQIGNEINQGFLWPTGKISGHDFSGASKLLHAGASAVRKASPSTKNVIHLANGWNKEDVSYFFTGIFETTQGQDGFLKQSDVDMMGFSFYPFYGTAATLENLGSSMDYVVSTYKKDIMIVETDWPAVCDTTATPLSEPTIPVGVDGQIAWTKEIVTTLNKLRQAVGIIYWEPGWITNAALGSSCSDNVLVTSEGVIRSSMALFREM